MLDTRIFSNATGVARAVRNALAQLLPPPDMPPSEWAESPDGIRIPAGNAIPGPYRVANAPIQREPIDQLVNPDCYRVTLMWGAQIGKTTVALVNQGYCIAMRPQSQMMSQPSQGDVQVWLETKFNPLVESSPSIASKIAKPRGREGVNNQKMKSYFGGFLMLAWAGSAKTMRGRSAPKIFCDEVDGYPRTDEGHPVSLLWQRSATFGDERFLMEISTPTIKDFSYIEAAFKDGDQRRFHVICPHCEHHQVMRWENVSWIGRVSLGLDDAAKDAEHDDHDPGSVAYVCESCNAPWNDGQRVAALREAEANGAGWKATKPFKGHASYHAWEAYSTFRKLGEIVRDYLAKLKTDDLQTFVNVSLSQTWEAPGDKVDPEGLQARAEVFAAEVPMGACYLTAGIDMQADRLEAEIVAWGPGEESWSVDYRVLWGDPLAGEVWDDLDDLLASTYTHETGAPLRIMAACMDTGGTSGYTQAAYEYLRGKTGRRLFGIKGVSGWGRPIVEKALRKQSGRNARKVDLYLVGTDEATAVVMRRLGVEKPGPGYCHVPAHPDNERIAKPDAHLRGDAGETNLAEWCRQITAERLVVHYVKGQPVREWHKPDKARNEAVDCRKYATAALKIMQPPLRRLHEKLMLHPRANGGQPPPAAKPRPQSRRPRPEAQDIPSVSSERPAKQTPRIHRSPAARRAKNWVNGWK